MLRPHERRKTWGERGRDRRACLFSLRKLGGIVGPLWRAFSKTGFSSLRSDYLACMYTCVCAVGWPDLIGRTITVFEIVFLPYVARCGWRIDVGRLQRFPVHDLLISWLFIIATRILHVNRWKLVGTIESRLSSPHVKMLKKSCKDLSSKKTGK